MNSWRLGELSKQVLHGDMNPLLENSLLLTFILAYLQSPLGSQVGMKRLGHPYWGMMQGVVFVNPQLLELEKFRVLGLEVGFRVSGLGIRV